MVNRCRWAKLFLGFYQPIFLCESITQMLHYLLFLLSPISATIIGELTDCNYDNTRSVYFYNTLHPPTSNSTSAIPPPLHSLPCDISCQPGMYLTYDTPTSRQLCEMCPENTFSIGGGIRVDETNWESLGKYVVNECSGESYCRPWEISMPYLYANASYIGNLNFILQAHVRVVNDGGVYG